MYNVEIATIDELDIQEWNDLLSKSEICDAFQTYEWAQVLRHSMNVEPVFLSVQNNRETIGGVMFFKKKMFGISDCYEIRGGPLYVGRNRSAVMERIIKVLGKKKARAIYLLFVPYPLINCGLKETFNSEGYLGFPFSTIIIDLRSPLENIWRALDKRARRRVRKAEHDGVEVTVAETWQEWKEYYDLHVFHGREKRYPTNPYNFFEEMFKLHHKNMSRLFIAKYEKQIVAGILCLIYRKNLVCLQSASLDAFLKYNPNNLVRWKTIEWAGENGITTYDIGGLPWEKTPYLRGVYEFKKQWDGNVQWYYYYLNRRLLFSGMHLVRTSSLAWSLFSYLRDVGIV